MMLGLFWSRILTCLSFSLSLSLSLIHICYIYLSVCVFVSSGLDHVTGIAYQPCIQANWTFNFHLLKSGQLSIEARENIGELWTADV